MKAPLRLSIIAITVAAATGCASIEHREPLRIVGHQAVRHGTASDAEAQYALGKYYLGQNRAALALIAFTRAIEYDPQHAEAHNGRASALVQLGDLERAGQDLARAIELSPKSAHLLNNLGYLRIQQRDFIGAAESLRRAFELEPRNPRVVANWRMLAATVSGNPELARMLRAPARQVEPGLAELPAPSPTPSVVRSLSAALSGPVVNLDYSRLATAPTHAPGAEAASATTPASPGARSDSAAPSTSVVDLERRQPVTEPARATAVVTVEAPRSSAPTAPAIEAAAAQPAPARLSVVNLEAAAPVEAAASDRALAPVAVGAVVDVAAVVRAARIEVSNGNGVRGMAALVASQLAARDFRVARITNAGHFGHPETKIYFRDGYLQEALRLSRTLAAHPALLLNNSLPSRSDVRVVIGRDLAARPGAVVADAAGRRLAMTTTGSTAAR